MPLPPALAARLAKRGIISKEKQSSTLDEEIIAESYDNPNVEHANTDEFGNILPSSWQKVWENDNNTWYYWDTESGKVSWLPPNDPEAVITNPASKKVLIDSKPVERKFDDAPVSGDKNHYTRPMRRGQAEKRKFREREEFDPMDPSSYSDAPRGDWTIGLKKVNDAKSGVDSTANGPLFQQRPYPSPGEVLSRNKQASRNFGPIKP